ncbi:MAG TPA: endo alpha-1,4 polygalactosaminidase [Kofleriaceae bacterium]|nr:endo alpha-1,4 polygalactosaminidase [Kofleriaceae bacterium]
MRTRGCVLVVAIVSAACGGGGGSTQLDAPTGGGGDGGGSGIDAPLGGVVTLPPVNGAVDYQLGGAYPPPAGVTIVSRDRTAQRAPGLYNICYVNGFQIQPGEESFWTTQHPELILRDAQNQPVIDADWNEMLIDVSTPAKRAAVAAIVDEWIAGCGVAGFAAIEIDNLDSFSRSQGLLTEDNAVAAMRLFADSAHARGLAISQKNSAELVGRKAEMATDFVVAEECNRYAECGDYTAAYGEHVIVIEYRQQDFDAGCSAFPGLSMVLRDRNLVMQGATGYVFAGC